MEGEMKGKTYANIQWSRNIFKVRASPYRVTLN